MILYDITFVRFVSKNNNTVEIKTKTTFLNSFRLLMMFIWKLSLKITQHITLCNGYRRMETTTLNGITFGYGTQGK